jgi:hypothetical protein
LKIEDPWLKKQYEALLETLRTAAHFECIACLYAKPKDQAEGVHVYEPRSEMVAHYAHKAVYVLCAACAGLPDVELHQKVTRNLAARGLFGNHPQPAAEPTRE